MPARRRHRRSAVFSWPCGCETVPEITGAVETMREKMLKVEAPADAIDIVGTGGDASGSFNISTCAAFTPRAPVSRSPSMAIAHSSKSGAADVLTALGVKIDLAPERITECIEEAGVGFMFAPAHHVSMKHVGPSRVELGTRTIFNLRALSPIRLGFAASHRRLCEELGRTLAEVLANSASAPGFVMAKAASMKSYRPAALVAELKNGKVTTFEVTPEDVGLERGDVADLRGGDAAHNAEALIGVLAGAKGAFRDSAAMTAGSALLVSGKAKTFAEGVRMAEASIDQGAARKSLEKLVKVSHG